MRRFVFITGAGRCGTKLMHGLLDGNNGLNIVPGEVTNFFIESLRKNGFSNNIYNVNLNEILKNIISEYKSVRIINQKFKFNKIVKSLKNKFRKRSFISINQYMDIIINTLFPNKKLTLINIQDENITGLLQTFQNSKVIHMLRNPLTQINSRYLFRYKSPQNYNGEEFSSSFYRNYNSFQNAYLMQNDKRVLIIKMENLIQNTKNEIKKTCKFLSIKFSKINLNVTVSGKSIQSNSGSGIKKITNDFSCLTPNDLYVASKIKYVNKFYKLKKFNKRKNSFFIFFLRHLGFVGKGRLRTFNPYRLVKCSVFSVYLFFLDKHLKNKFYIY